MLKHLTYINEARVEQIEDRLATIFNECVNTRKLYEEEVKMSYVKKQRIQELGDEVQSLESEIASLQDQLKTTLEVELAHRIAKKMKLTIEMEVQTQDIPTGVELHTPMINIEGDIPRFDGVMR